MDDDPLVRRTLARVLQAQGLVVTEASSADEAVAHLAAPGHIPLVLTDIYMPGMSGVELLRDIRARYPATGAVMITGVAELAGAVECLQLGALDYLAKPVQIDEVRGQTRSIWTIIVMFTLQKGILGDLWQEE